MSTMQPLAFSNTVPETPYHDYGMHYTSDGRRRDIVVCDSDSARTPLYFARMSVKISTKEQPHLSFYSVKHVDVDPEVIADGTKLKSKQGKAGDVLGMAYFPAFSKRIEIGIGSPNTTEKIRWETVNVPKLGIHEFAMTTSPSSRKYTNTFSPSIGNAEVLPETKVKYQWRGTHTAVEEQGKGIEARKKLVNEHGEVVALFIPNGWKQLNPTGTLRIFKEQFGSTTNTLTGIDKEMEIQVILSRCAIVEKLHR